MTNKDKIAKLKRQNKELKQTVEKLLELNRSRLSEEIGRSLRYRRSTLRN